MDYRRKTSRKPLGKKLGTARRADILPGPPCAFWQLHQIL